MATNILPCGCVLDSYMTIPNDTQLENMAGKTLRGYANGHNISPTGVSTEGFSRWRNQANASELRLALRLHRDGLAHSPSTAASVQSGTAAPESDPRIPALMDAIKQLLSTVSPSVIEQHILDRVESEVAKYRTTLQRIEVNSPTGGSVQLDTQHKDFPKLVKLVAARVNVMLVGPAGSGKTEAAMAAAKAMGIPFEIIAVGPQTMQSELAGFKNAAGQYMESAVRRAYSEGKLLILDEMDAGNPGVFTFLNGTLSNAYAGFPDGVVQRHDNFRVIGCANTFGTGADMVYVGRQQLDGATTDRYATLTWDYDEAFETHLALQFNSEARPWVEKVQGWRKNMLKHRIRHVISPRASIMGAKMLAAGVSDDECAAMLVFKGLNKEVSDKIRGKETA